MREKGGSYPFRMEDGARFLQMAAREIPLRRDPKPSRLTTLLFIMPLCTAPFQR